jgi:hypothetical protein
MDAMTDEIDDEIEDDEAEEVDGDGDDESESEAGDDSAAPSNPGGPQVTAEAHDNLFGLDRWAACDLRELEAHETEVIGNLADFKKILDAGYTGGSEAHGAMTEKIVEQIADRVAWMARVGRRRRRVIEARWGSIDESEDHPHANRP